MCKPGSVGALGARSPRATRPKRLRQLGGGRAATAVVRGTEQSNAVPVSMEVRPRCPAQVPGEIGSQTRARVFGVGELTTKSPHEASILTPPSIVKWTTKLLDPNAPSKKADLVPFLTRKMGSKEQVQVAVHRCSSSCFAKVFTREHGHHWTSIGVSGYGPWLISTSRSLIRCARRGSRHRRTHFRTSRS